MGAAGGCGRGAKGFAKVHKYFESIKCVGEETMELVSEKSDWSLVTPGAGRRDSH